MNSGKGKIGHVIQAISMIPLLLFGAAIVLMSYRVSIGLLETETKTELANSAYQVLSTFNSLYPGDYELVGDVNLSLQKGKIDITREYDLFDSIKEKTGYDMALFYEDTMILSTFRDKSGSRLVGLGCGSTVMEEVFDTGESAFYKDVLISKKQYYAHYEPLKNMNGTVKGMFSVYKPTSLVHDAAVGSLFPLIIAFIIMIVAIAIFIFLYTRRFVGTLGHISDFLGKVSGGNLNAELPAEVTKRNDEFGFIGRSVVSMQDSLRHMLEQDALTKLFNRHFGNRKLEQIQKKAQAGNYPFALSIGDIDFFKKVNDTYGHDAGDLVLKNVAEVLRKNMLSCGFVARWGGEEFLLVFDRMSKKEAAEKLEDILNQIREMESSYQDTTIKVTMTFGISEGPLDSIESLIKAADNKLYNGKQSGRNRIITED